VGGNLLAEQIQRWRDGADRQAVEAWVADVVEANPEAREDFDAVLLATDAVPQVQAGLSNTDRAWFDGRLRQELTALGNLSRFEAHLTGSGAIASGHARAVGEHGVLVEGNVGGDVIIGDKTTVFDTRGQTIGSKQIISGDYHDNRRSGPTYVTNIEHAESLAIGTGAQVLPQTPPSPGTAGVEPSDLRRRLNCLDDVELDALCLDHFPSVYDKFARGLRRDEKVNLLLDYVRRHPAESGRLATFLSGC